MRRQLSAQRSQALEPGLLFIGENSRVVWVVGAIASGNPAAQLPQWAHGTPISDKRSNRLSARTPAAAAISFCCFSYYILWAKIPATMNTQNQLEEEAAQARPACLVLRQPAALPDRHGSVRQRAHWARKLKAYEHCVKLTIPAVRQALRQDELKSPCLESLGYGVYHGMFHCTVLPTGGRDDTHPDAASLVWSRRDQRDDKMSTVRLQSLLTCPRCGQYFYECPACHELLRPKAGDCCVFCSYGDVPCPPVQEQGKRKDCHP